MKTVKEILDHHGLYGEDPGTVCKAVADMLDLYADTVEEREPYATTTADLRRIAMQVYSLENDLADYGLVEGEDDE